MTTSGAAQEDAVRRALEVVVDGEPLFTSVQSTWNLLETSVAPALAEAAAAGVHVIVKESLANGRLAPGSPDHGPGVGRAAAMAATLDVGLDQLAMAAALARPWAARVLSGAASPEQVASNAASTELTLSEEVLEELDTLAEEPTSY